jgi:uridine monophosphate synthetase
MKPFFSLLSDRAQAAGSLLCVGLDPSPADLHADSVQVARDFCMRLIDATVDLVAAYKPNIAFFEAFGPVGLATLQEVIATIPPDIPVIVDAKRGDIASTAEAYVQAIFHILRSGAVTVNPYLGRDAVAPFLRDPEHGVFLLCKTSNPGAADIQELRVLSHGAGDKAGLLLYEHVARLAQEWEVNGFTHHNLGLVVGATYPDALVRVREITPDFWFLVPGVGAQGGDLPAALKAGLRSDGSGLLVSVSRGISQAEHPRAAADHLRNEINQFRTGSSRRSFQDVSVTPDVSTSQVGSLSSNLKPGLERLADALLSVGCVKFGQYTLKSGSVSPIYIDLRQLVSTPGLLAQVAEAFLPLLKQVRFDRLAALPYAGLPITTAIGLQSGWPMIYPRKEAKSYGTQVEIEGTYQAGERVVVIDDLATTGASKFEAIAKLTNAGLQVADVVVLIDRQSGAAQALEDAGYRLHAVFQLSQLLDYWQRSGKVPGDQIEAARQFIGIV